MSIDVFMVSCPERWAQRAATLASWAETDFAADAVHVVVDNTCPPPDWCPTSLARLTATWMRVLDLAARSRADLVLLLEDDIRFNRYLRSNLASWPTIRVGPYLFANLYNNSLAISSHPIDRRTLLVAPAFAWGGQAVLSTPATIAFALSQWDTESGAPDVRLPKLAARVTPLLIHTPSLVEHVGDSTWAAKYWRWGPNKHTANDFNPNWVAA